MKHNANPIDRAYVFWSSNDDSFHTTETIAAVTELSINTLSNWRAQGTGPVFFKQGKMIYYRKKDILTWFESFQPSRFLAA